MDNIVTGPLMIGVGFITLLIVIGLIFGPIWGAFSGLAPVDHTATMDWHNLVGFAPIFAVIVAIVFAVRSTTPPNQQAQNGY